MLITIYGVRASTTVLPVVLYWHEAPFSDFLLGVKTVHLQLNLPSGKEPLRKLSSLA